MKLIIMGLDNIEKLIERYENGETTLKEEQQLKHYFNNETVEPHLEVYKSMFTYFSQNQTERFTKTLPLETKRKNNYKWLAVAAVAIIMLGVVFNPLGGPTDQEQKEALLAYNQTMEAFNLVSNQLNQSKEKLAPFKMMNSNLQEGIQKANLINEFSETTNIVYNTSNN